MTDPFDNDVAGKKIKFDMTEDPGDDKVIITIYGLKNHGKTSIALAFPGSKYVLTFDNKTQRIKKSMYPDDDIQIYNAVKYWNKSPQHITSTAVITMTYIDKLLDEAEDKDNRPDWVVIDAMELLQQVCEMNMRYRHDLGMSQGFGNKSWWKERKAGIEHVHNRAKALAKRGVIYTTFCSMKDMLKDGEVINTKEVPNWIGIVMEETDVVIHAFTDMDATKNLFFMAFIEGSKVPNEFKTIPTGRLVNVTGDVREKLFGDVPKVDEVEPKAEPTKVVKKVVKKEVEEEHKDTDEEVGEDLDPFFA